MRVFAPTPLSSVAATTQAFADAAAAGVGAAASRYDHKHGMPSVAWELIAVQTLSGTAASVSFASINTAYKAFRLTAEILPTAALGINLNLNNDVSPTYKRTVLYAIQTPAVGAVVRNADNFIALCDVSGTAVFPQPSVRTLLSILISQQTAAEIAAVTWSLNAGTVLAPNLQLGAGLWTLNAGTVSRIDLSASTSTFAATSRFVLEGCRQ